MARAFLAAGAKAVVATQWPVGASSADFMAEFHGHLAQSEAAATALRAAKLAMRHRPNTSHPFHWAGFIIVSRQ